jgi:hypothetical protein
LSMRLGNPNTIGCVCTERSLISNESINTDASAGRVASVCLRLAKSLGDLAVHEGFKKESKLLLRSRLEQPQDLARIDLPASDERMQQRFVRLESRELVFLACVEDEVFGRAGQAGLLRQLGAGL